jgi:hypothetical protein
VEIGIHSFGELVPDPHTHQKISAHERLKNVIQMAMPRSSLVAAPSSNPSSCLDLT